MKLFYHDRRRLRGDSAIHMVHQTTTFIVGGWYTPERCQGIHVMDSKTFFPMSWYEASQLSRPIMSAEEWREFLVDSYSIDFYHSSGQNHVNIMQPKFYGKKLPAYAYLAPTYCPVSYYSEVLF